MSSAEIKEVTTAADELVKPDMQAVLSRTHLSVTLENYLLPVFEAVSNAIHGIKEKFGDKAGDFGEIKIHFANFNDPTTVHVTVLDNGVGLDSDNYESFKTPFSGHKLRQHGRGFGRFIAFKVFSKSYYRSKYEDIIGEQHRYFQFDIYNQKEIVHMSSGDELSHTGVQVEFSHPLTAWHDLVRSMTIDGVSDAIGSHFLPQFLYGWLPDISIQIDNDDPSNISEHFKAIFVQSDSGNIECEIDGNNEILHYAITKVEKSASFKNHCLLFSAADRIVGSPRDLSNKIGNQYFVGENNEKYVVLAIVSGPAFETRLNDSRTGLNITPKVIEDIVSTISDVIQNREIEQIAKIKHDQSLDLESALLENPILKLGLRGKSITQYVASKPNNWRAENFISDLAIQRYRASNDLSKDIALAASNPENYKERIQELAGKLDNNQKQALAEYVLHRKSVIELVEAARRFGENGERAQEEVIHDLVFRRFNDNISTNYFQHNLWLIDDTLSFLPYISSDRTMHGGIRRKGVITHGFGQ